MTIKEEHDNFNRVDAIYKTSGLESFLDEDGYPTEACLDWIKYYPYDKPIAELIKVLKSIWWHPDYSFDYTEETGLSDNIIIKVNVSTLGWSGNESVINALEENLVFWGLYWYQSTTGGHYVFRFKEEINEICEILESS